MSTPVTTAPAGHPARRRLLQAAALVAGVSGLAACQESPLHEPGSSEGVGVPAGDPDDALLAAAARDEARMVSMLSPLLATGPAAVRRTVQVHRAHLALLDQPDEPEQDGAGAAAPQRLRPGGIAAAEERLARRHAQAALRASSGQFARVLAAMAAAAAQQAAVWRQAGAGA